MIEVALVFDKEGNTIAWHEPGDASGGAIPDSPDLWQVLWENRERLGGVAHTHPWNGEAHASGTDLTTFDALERALGRTLWWPVVTFTASAWYIRTEPGGEFRRMGAADAPAYMKVWPNRDVMMASKNLDLGGLRERSRRIQAGKA